MRWECTNRVERAKKKLPPDGLKALDKAKEIIEEAKDINAFQQHLKVRKMAGSRENERVKPLYRADPPDITVVKLWAFLSSLTGRIRSFPVEYTLT